MRAGLARASAIGTIQAVCPDATIVDEPLGPRSHGFTIRGTVDIDDARKLERRLRDVVLGGMRTVIVDLSDVDELSSSLVGVLIRTQRSLSWRGGRLLIASESEAIRHQLTDLNDIFELVDERPQRR
jgi:anti-sigma B factor antagonist